MYNSSLWYLSATCNICLQHDIGVYSLWCLSIAYTISLQDVICVCSMRCLQSICVYSMWSLTTTWNIYSESVVCAFRPCSVWYMSTGWYASTVSGVWLQHVIFVYNLCLFLCRMQFFYCMWCVHCLWYFSIVYILHLQSVVCVLWYVSTAGNMCLQPVICVCQFLIRIQFVYYMSHVSIACGMYLRHMMYL